METTRNTDGSMARAWLAFLQAIAEAQELHKGGAEENILADLLQHSRELLEIIRDEVIIANGAMPKTAEDALVELQYRVTTLEQLLVPGH